MCPIICKNSFKYHVYYYHDSKKYYCYQNSWWTIMTVINYCTALVQSKVVHSDSAPTHDVIDAGEKALVLVTMKCWLTQWIPSDMNVSVKRWIQEHPKVKPQSLPPTSAAANYHSLYVHLPVQEWKRSAAELNPRSRDWGCQEFRSRDWRCQEF